MSVDVTPRAWACDGIDDDVDLALAAAVERRARDAGDALEERLDVVERVVVELRAGEAAARDGDLHDRRVRRIVLEDERRQHAERLRHGGHRERRPAAARASAPR